MSNPRSLSAETVHGTSVASDGRAVLLTGRSGAGKSDLALRLLDRGFKLVSDDQTILGKTKAVLVATAPATIAGRMEVRGLGLAIARAIVEGHDGTIDVSDRDDAPSGARFTIRIPAASVA